MSGRPAARGVRVRPPPLVPGPPVATTGRPFETALIIAGLRCTLRYVVVPFGLPLLGAATGTLGHVTDVALYLLLTLDVVAAVAIVTTLRRLWRLQHPHRWAYLPVALALAMLVGIFLLNDLSSVFT